MSLFEDERYSWRETYFVLLDPSRRPDLTGLRQELLRRAAPIEFGQSSKDAQDRLESLTVASFVDHSAIELIYREGPEVAQELDALLQSIGSGRRSDQWDRVCKLAQHGACFDVLHFEQTAGTAAFKLATPAEPPRKRAERSRVSFSTKDASSKLASEIPRRVPRFHFDPDSFERCRGCDLPEMDEDDFCDEDSSIIERVNPSTLVLVLEILARQCHGVVVDPTV